MLIKSIKFFPFLLPGLSWTSLPTDTGNWQNYTHNNPFHGTLLENIITLHRVRKARLYSFSINELAVSLSYSSVCYCILGGFFFNIMETKLIILKICFVNVASVNVVWLQVCGPLCIPCGAKPSGILTVLLVLGPENVQMNTAHTQCCVNLANCTVSFPGDVQDL